MTTMKILQNWEEITSYTQPSEILPYGKEPFWPKEKEKVYLCDWMCRVALALAIFLVVVILI